MDNKQKDKASNLASQIIKLSQNTLLMSLRFMDSAIFRLNLKEADTTMMTDGVNLYYGVPFILKKYKEDPKIITRSMLHTVLHCVFSHSFVDLTINKDIWDLSADIAIENLIDSLELNVVKNVSGSNRKKELNKLREKLDVLTAEKIYNYYIKTNLSYEKARILRNEFMIDEHDCWYDRSIILELSIANTGDKKDNEDNEDSENQSLCDVDMSEIIETWKDVSRGLKLDLETFSKEKGDLASDLLLQLGELNKEKYDYSSFLKKFAVMGEAMKINDDEFDYIYYTYGINLYGDMPLIEPLEYKEEKRIKEFVVAIDTSGSVLGELIQLFIKKTYNILKSTESFFSKINLHIIQCDAKIQEHVKITSQEEFDRYIENMKLRGFGGTDFRPVFKMVDELVENKEFTHLKGLIYLTDGYGNFPSYKPAYETAFVFIRNQQNIPEVPSWAIKLELDEEDIERFE